MKSWVFVIMAVLVVIMFVVGVDWLHLLIVAALFSSLAVVWEIANRPPGIQDRAFPLPNLFRTGIAQRFTFLAPSSPEPIGTYAGTMAEQVLREALSEFPGDPLLRELVAEHGGAMRYLPQRKLTEALNHIDQLFSQGAR